MSKVSDRERLLTQGSHSSLSAASPCSRGVRPASASQTGNCNTAPSQRTPGMRDCTTNQDIWTLPSGNCLPPILLRTTATAVSLSALARGHTKLAKCNTELAGGITQFADCIVQSANYIIPLASCIMQPARGIMQFAESVLPLASCMMQSASFVCPLANSVMQFAGPQPERASGM